MNQSTLTVPEKLFEELSRKVDDSPFKNVNELAAYALQLYLDQEQSREDQKSPADTEEEVRKRLKNLGYL